MSGAKVGQVYYTWASARPGGVEGHGFVAMSPSMKDQMPWIEAESKGGLTNFGGTGREMDPEERDAYSPIGRHLGHKGVLGYRKTYAGLDAHDRPGRYIVHFLVAGPTVLTLSGLLRIPTDSWLTAVALDTVPDLPDLPSQHLIPSPQPLSAKPDHLAELWNSVVSLARDGQLDVTQWNGTELRILMACLPSWCDAGAELLPRWTKAGQSMRLVLHRSAADFAEVDARDGLEQRELANIRDRLAGAQDIAQLRDRVRPRAETAKQPPAVPAAAKDNRLSATIDVWLERGSKSLDSHQRAVLTDEPLRTLETMRSTGRRLPSGRRGDELAVDILRLVTDADPDLIAQVLPIEDGAVSVYLASVTTPALMQACLLLNGRDLRRVEIPVVRKLQDAHVAALVSMCNDSELLRRGLAHTMRISVEGTGAFARAVLTAHRVDYNLLYSTVLPQAAQGRPDTLLTMACINPEEFVAWIRVSTPYQEALVEALKPETRQAIWQQMYNVLAMWKRNT